MIHFLLCYSRAADKMRLARWYSAYSLKEKGRVMSRVGREVSHPRHARTSFIDYEGDKRLVYRR
jgi:hypothetical protein